jgi:uncharacterized YccA/Bax inhibitor family protein
MMDRLIRLNFGSSPLRFSPTSSNPALLNPAITSAAHGDVCTVTGVVNCTGMAIVATIGGGVMGGGAIQQWPGAMLPIFVLSLVVTLIAFFLIYRNPANAVWAIWPYAIAEGMMLGAITVMLDQWLVQLGYIAFGGLALQAFIITISITMGMLGLYWARILKPTKKFQAVLMVLTVGIILTYVTSMVVGLFNGTGLPFVSMNSALEGGSTAWIGLGISVLFLGVASFWLILDFGRVEHFVNTGMPRKMQWYLAFSLLVTLAWIYLEAVKLAFRLAIMTGQRR